MSGKDVDEAGSARDGKGLKLGMIAAGSIAYASGLIVLALVAPFIGYRGPRGKGR